MKLERSIGNLAKKLDRLYPEFSSYNNTGLSHWRGKPIIPLDKWIELSYTPYKLDYFPDDFDQILTYTSESELEKGQERLKDIEKWNSDFADLMEHTKNRNYGKAKCFHCLLSPAGDDPIFIGINRLVAKGLRDGEQHNILIEYPCRIVNRFRCPYETSNIRVDEDVGDTNSNFDVDDLFRLQRMAFTVEIAFAKARKDDSRIRVRNKEELLHALTDKETLTKILEQGSEALEVSEDIRTYLEENHHYILNFFMSIEDKVNMEELRFY